MAAAVAAEWHFALPFAHADRSELERLARMMSPPVHAMYVDDGGIPSFPSCGDQLPPHGLIYSDMGNLSIGIGIHNPDHRCYCTKRNSSALSPCRAGRERGRAPSRPSTEQTCSQKKKKKNKRHQSTSLSGDNTT
jgi:hypothetical protein